MTLFLGIVFSSCASTSTVFDIENLYSDTIKETVEIRCYDTEDNTMDIHLSQDIATMADLKRVFILNIIIPRLPLCMDCRIAFLEALK